MPAGELGRALNGPRLRGRRRRAQRAALAVVAALAFLLGAVASGLVGYVTAVSGAAVQDTFDDVPATERVFELSARVADDPAAQDETAVAAFDRFVGDAAYDLHRSLLTEPRQLLDPDSPQADDADAGLPRLALSAYESLSDHAELVTGEWPAAAPDGARVPVALHEGAASALAIEVGDELVFEERRTLGRLVVVGLWRPSEPDSDYWFASSLETTGTANGDGLAVVAEEDLLGLPGPVPIVRWRLVPDIDAVTLADLSELRLGLPSIRPYLADDPLFSGAGVGVDDEIIAGLEGTDDALLASRSVAIAPLLLAVVSAIGAIGLVSRLLGENRLGETLLLRGRGWSRTQATGWALRESLRMFALPALLGGATGYGLLWLFAGTDLDVPLAGAAVGTGVVIVAGVVTLVVAAARAAGPAHVTVEQRATASRRQVVGRASTVTLVFAAAALATWQLRRYDGVTVLGADGVRRLDPLAVAAPAAILLACAVVVAGLMVVLGRVVERVLRRRRGLAGVDAARVLARQPATYVLPVVLITLAAGGGALAAAYSSTWHDLQRDFAASQAAADVDVTLPGSGLITEAYEPPDLSEYRELPGVAELDAAASRSATISDGEVDVVATAGAAPPPGIELPTGEQSIDVELTTDLQIREQDEQIEGFGPPEPPEELGASVRWWLTDADGTGAVVESGQLSFPVGTPGTVNAVLELPSGGAQPWRIVGADIRIDVPSLPRRPADFAVAISEVSAGDADVSVPGDGWTGDTFSTLEGAELEFSSPGTAEARVSGTLAFIPGQLTARLAHADGPVPVTASDAALDRFGLAVGDTAEVDMFGGDLDIEVIGRTSAVHGAERTDALGADLHHLVAAALAAGQQPPAPNRIWLTTTPGADSAALLDKVPELAGPDAGIRGRAAIEEELIGSSLAQLIVTTFWAVSGISGGLALIGVAAGAASALRRRRGEVAVQRALGLSAGQQGRQRWREQLLVSLVAVVLGAAAGYAAGVLTLPALAGSATPGLPDGVVPAITVDPVVLGAFLATLALVLAGVVVVHARRVRRQARNATRAEVVA